MISTNSALVRSAASAIFMALAAAAPAHARATTNIVEAAAATPDLSTLVTAVKAADLVGTLSSKGPFTVFAPTNAAFAKLPKGTVETLVKPANKKKLTKILTAHVVAGDVSSGDLLALIKKGAGHARLKTVSGDRLVASTKNGKIFIKDENGGTAQVSAADLKQSNGVVHVVSSVLLPK
ncbi:MAG: fasciclin domain-containing protein [Hyphomicrobiaceae bacterium]|nr:fasciclin domain-containing protein [Hyphomicrobiaceae bacterium]